MIDLRDLPHMDLHGAIQHTARVAVLTEYFTAGLLEDLKAGSFPSHEALVSRVETLYRLAADVGTVAERARHLVGEPREGRRP
jgi:hypothetical protein